MSSWSGRTAARARAAAMALVSAVLAIAFAIAGAGVARADELGGGSFAIFVCQSAGGTQNAFTHSFPSVGNLNTQARIAPS